MLAEAAAGGNAILLVGYNRRFAPLMRQMKGHFASVADPLVIAYTVNAGFIPKKHWTQDEDEGAGRIIGEVCHFVDVAQYLSDSEPVKVYAQSIASANQEVTNSDNIIVTLTMQNGSIASITYIANNDPSIPKESCAVSGGGRTAVLHNYNLLDLYSRGGKRTIKPGGMDKGHKDEIGEFLRDRA